MSTILASLKARLADVPGIEQMSMQLLVGRQNYSIGGKVISVDAMATEAEAEAAIRAALSSPAVAHMPAGSPLAPAAGSSALLPSVNLQTDKEKTTMSITGAGGTAVSLKAMVDAQRQKIAQALEDGMKHVQAGFDKQNEAVAALNSLGDKVHSEADDLLASVGQFANDIVGGGSK